MKEIKKKKTNTKQDHKYQKKPEGERIIYLL